MDVAYHPAARAEFRAAARWYERERPQVGLAFIAAVRDAEALLGEHPDVGTPLGSNRRLLVSHFPYSLIYRREPARLFILAIAHARRRPDYWHNRQ